MNVWGKVAGKRKAFLSLLCDGIPPYEACRKVWPKLRDVHGHVTRIFDDKGFRDAYARLTDCQNNRDTLLSDCRRIVEDPNAKSADRLGAIKVIGMLKGYITLGRTPTSRGKPKAIDDDKALLDRMAELGRKATNGHLEKPS